MHSSLSAAVGTGARQAARYGKAAFAGFILTLVAFWPGLLSSDSIDQYGQALSLQFNDWHPPVMAWLWSVLNALLTGPAGMLVFHLALIWAGCALLAEGVVRLGGRAAWMLLLVPVSPWIVSILGVVWKDVGLAAALVMVLGITVHRLSHSPPRSDPGWLQLSAAVSLLAYAWLVRANGPAAVIPLVPLVVATWMPGGRWRKVAGASFGLVVLLAALQLVAAPWLFSARSAMAHQGIMIHDLAGIEARTGVRALSGYFAGQPDHQFVARAYSPVTVDSLIFGADQRVPVSADKEFVRQLQRHWLGAIAHDWRAYLAHRAAVFEAMLFAPPGNRYVVHETTDNNPWGFAFHPNGLTQVFFRAAKWLGGGFLFAGWFWLLAVTIGLFVAVVVPIEKAARWTAIAIFASALGYFLPYFFVAVAPSYRYFYWPVVAGTLGWCLMGTLIARGRLGKVES